jgi:hypothetical protein
MASKDDDIKKALAGYIGAYPNLPHGNIRRSDGRPDFDYLRRLYAVMTPELVASERWVDVNFIQWLSVLTPIEQQMWSLIRSQQVPFYPQYPVGGYFLDFANPRLKIGIECDSRSWHDRRADLDELRARDLYELGWLVFGFSGRACMRLPGLPPVWEMAAQWRAEGHGEPLPGTRFSELPRRAKGDWPDDAEIDLAQFSTFEWFGPALYQVVWAEEDAELGLGDED